MARFLVTDTETGGLDPDIYSILSAAGVVWENGQIAAQKEVFILEPRLIVDPKALEINRIDIVEHAKKALPVDKAMQEFQGFIQDEFGSHSATLVGWNLPFDIGFIRRFCRLAGVDYAKLFSHRILDLASVAQFLYARGLIPPAATSSTGVFEHFDITFAENERHTALGDAQATARLLSKMLHLLPVAPR